MKKTLDFDPILRQIGDALGSAISLEEGVAESMRIINAALPYFSWVGVYWLDDQNNELYLGPYIGARTEHTRIKIGRGVCGTAVAENANQLIENVRQLDNYIACNLDVRSEIVVLIRDHQGRIIGQIDADGHEVGAFDEKDEAFLEKVAGLISSAAET